MKNEEKTMEEKSEAPKRNKKKKSDTCEGKSDTQERKFNCLAKASEVSVCVFVCDEGVCVCLCLCV